MESTAFGTEYPDQTVLFREDDPGDHMYVIQDGQVEISCLVDGSKLVLSVLKKGEFFGEMALFEDRPRTATATALGKARLMVLSRDTVKQRLQSDPFTALSLLKMTCQRLRSLHESIDELVASGEASPEDIQRVLLAHRPA